MNGLPTSTSLIWSDAPLSLQKISGGSGKSQDTVLNWYA